MSSEACVVQPAPPRIANGRSAPASSVRRRLDVGGSRARLHDAERRCVRRFRLLREHVLRQREHDRAGPAGAGDRVRARDELGDAVDAVDLGDPLRERAEHPPVVDLLERLALLLRRGDLADEQDQRRRVLVGGVHADGGLRRAGPARDHADPRPPGQLAVGLGRIRGAGLVPARDQPDRRLVQPVEQLEVALAGHAEHELRAVHRELVGQQLAAAPAHSRLLQVDVGALQLRLLLVGRVDVA